MDQWLKLCSKRSMMANTSSIELWPWMPPNSVRSSFSTRLSAKKQATYQGSGAESRRLLVLFLRPLFQRLQFWRKVITGAMWFTTVFALSNILKIPILIPTKRLGIKREIFSIISERRSMTLGFWSQLNLLMLLRQKEDQCSNWKRKRRCSYRMKRWESWKRKIKTDFSVIK
jgi:hypothetical protein